ncbi:HTH-type transcriptional regulator [Sphingobium phage Lacusarx]|uniref:HTH-type transcriptional regulator n=1 Tax=Sphingobium phage Lacusarx TaxID=1980139 RepID=A0A1W6DXD4_9CAUD|nr:transcriptional regulator [Sphingobium phage Lacusarx]ARK07432.1 HTH-type transcriptional regulator [Sphingobium phage Lacusarx]
MSKQETTTPRRIDIPGVSENVDLQSMGGRIAWARLRQNMTQKTLAGLAEKSRATIVQYEQNNIDPPVTIVEKLADVLNVSPEFLAFGRHGIEGIANAAEEVVTVPEITFGRDGEYTSGGFAFPKKMMDSFGVDKRGAKLFVLQQDAPGFNYRSGDRLIVNTKITGPVPEHDMYLLKTQTALEVVRCEPNLTRRAEMTFTGAKGQSFTIDPAELDFVGAIVGSVRQS